MINKRFLIPVLALLGCGIPAGASVVTYCQTYCGANDLATFNSITGGLGTGTQSTFSSGNISTNGSGLSQYLDVPSGLIFIDSNYDPLMLVSSSLQVSQYYDSVQVSVPASITAVVLSLSALGSGQQYTINGTTVNLSTSPVQIGFADSGGNIGTITINRNSGGPLVISGFAVAGADTGGGTGGSPTPEVGTMILIGTGLIAMRWMKKIPNRFFRTPQTAS